jgi:hypothetical protein
MEYFKQNKLAFLVAFLMLLFYGYMNYNGRVCFQCVEQSNWGPQNTRRHK